MSYEPQSLPDDGAWIEQAIQEREQEVAECIKRVISGTATLDDACVLAAECGVSSIVFPKPTHIGGKA